MFLKKLINRIIHGIRIRNQAKIINEYQFFYNENDKKCVEEIISNPNIYDFKRIPNLKGFEYQVTPEMAIENSFNFFKSLDSTLYNEIKQLYLKHKSSISLGELDEKIHGWGVTSKDEDGKITIIIKLFNDYRTYCTTAHEFIHLLEVEHGLHNEKLAEVNAMFIEILMCKYLCDKGIITKNDVKRQLIERCCRYDDALEIKLIEEIKKAKGKFNGKKLKNFAVKYCDNDDKMRDDIFYKMLPQIVKKIRGPRTYKPQDSLRNLNAVVGVNALYKKYANNPNEFIQKYFRIIKNKLEYNSINSVDQYINIIERTSIQPTEKTDNNANNRETKKERVL